MLGGVGLNHPTLMGYQCEGVEEWWDCTTTLKGGLYDFESGGIEPPLILPYLSISSMQIGEDPPPCRGGGAGSIGKIPQLAMGLNHR